MKHARADLAPKLSPRGTRGPRRFLALPRNDRRGFTLFEVILAIALAAVLLTLIGTAINLYLVQVDSGRARVEEAQLARSILSMIADDIRATTVYKPQDTSAIAQLMAKGATYDPDAIDAQGGLGKLSAISSTSGGTTALSQLSALSSTSASGSSGSSSSGGVSGSSTSGTSGTETDTSLQLGINGSLSELYVDATRLPRQEELFSTTTGYTNAQSLASDSGTAAGTGSGGVPATDLKTVHYFIRPGDPVETGSASVTALDPAAQAKLGGLVRQEIPRAMRNFAEKNGGSNVLESNQVLLAPEVVHMELHFFNGSEISETWDMQELKSLPLAVEVRIWLRSPDATNEPVTDSYDMATLSDKTHEYRQVVYIPMAAVANAAQTNSSTDSSSTDSTSSTSSTDGSGNGSSTSDGSKFNE